ncbi:N-acetyltransferase [Nocardioides euryhalodurans]|uniref:N-acetyltransferase n=1 Tax=Nocardioides euryhalodurans TaxID=2518370 RepID=A0A4P7GRC2_9ACTN|nr:N-acetyltransferase [Nocardioides euryhalodurans]
MTGDRRPTLRTERIRLEPLTSRHAELLVELDSDPEVLRHIFGRALPRDEVLTEHLPRRLRPDGPPRGIGCWAGFGTDDGRFLGWWTLAVDDEDPTTAELGYRLRRDAWGHGLATEGSRALLDHAFGTLRLPYVWATTMAVNAGSRGVMRKLGMTHVRTEVQEWDDPLPGAELGEVRYEISREDWALPGSGISPGPEGRTSARRS